MQVNTSLRWIGQFPSYLMPRFQNESTCKNISYDNESDSHEKEHVGRTHFQYEWLRTKSCIYTEAKGKLENGLLFKTRTQYSNELITANIPLERHSSDSPMFHLQRIVGDPLSSGSTTVLVRRTFGESASKLSSSQSETAVSFSSAGAFSPSVKLATFPFDPFTPYVKEWKQYTGFLLGMLPS